MRSKLKKFEHVYKGVQGPVWEGRRGEVLMLVGARAVDIPVWRGNHVDGGVGVGELRPYRFHWETLNRGMGETFVNLQLELGYD